MERLAGSRPAPMDPFEFEQSWEIIRALLPKDLDRLSRSSGLVRRLRGFQDAETLTRILLMHGTGLSLEQTAWRAREQGLGRVTAEALHHRLKHGGEFFRQLCQHVHAGLCAQLAEPAWPQGWKYRVIDATEVSEPGATGSTWRVHYSLRLPELSCDQFELTEAQRGESLKYWAIAADEVILADRAYSHREAVAKLIDKGAHFVIRLNSAVFTLERESGALVQLPQLLKKLKVGQPQAWRLFFRDGKRRLPIDLCAVRKSPQAAEQARRKARRRAQRDGTQIEEQTLFLADYVLVLTNLRDRQWPADRVLELYRCRWQVELAFKRLKSLLTLGHLPKKDLQTARAWMQMKLLIALLSERLLFDAKFIFPWGYNWSKPKPVESLSGNG